MFKTYLSSSKVSFEYLVKTKGGLKLSPKLVSQRIQFRGQLMMGPVVTERSMLEASDVSIVFRPLAVPVSQ
jgi:hypothetical protein